MSVLEFIHGGCYFCPSSIVGQYPPFFTPFDFGGTVNHDPITHDSCYHNLRDAKCLGLIKDNIPFYWKK